MRLLFQYIVLAVCLVFAGCGTTPENISRVDTLPPIFPDYADVTIPVGIAPMNFNVMADGVEHVDVVVKGSIGGEIHANGKWAKFDINKWHKLVEANVGATLTFTVTAKIDGRWVQYNDFVMYVSQYPLGEWGLTYRRIAPGYEIFSHMGLFQRKLSTFEETTIIDNSSTYGLCYNCHTSNRTNPSQFVFHVRGEHGATMIQQDGQREWLQAVNDSLGGSMVYPYWHPSGKYCAFSTNITRQGFHTVADERVEVFDHSSDVLVYNPATHEIILDSLLSQKEWSENAPVFSPDGRTLYFTTCRQQSYPLQFKETKYNLCSIAFDPDNATFGERVDTLFNAVEMGKSVTWAKPSYDGRFMLFTLIDYGYFSIWHREAEQWILDLQTGEARPLDEINSPDADSYHNWSLNSCWVVFTSRRQNGLYSQLFIASIDENGNATKPFLLPQLNPWKYYDETLYSFNVPDFSSEKVDFDLKSAIREINSDKRTSTKIVIASH